MNRSKTRHETLVLANSVRLKRSTNAQCTFYNVYIVVQLLDLTMVLVYFQNKVGTPKRRPECKKFLLGNILG